MSELTQSPAWRALQAHHASFARTLRQLFDEDGERAQRYRLEAAGLTLDYSKNHLDARTMQLLLALAAQQQVPTWIARMFRGDKINNTEQRAALHVALRNRANTPIYADGADVMPGVNAVLEKMQRFTQSVHSGSWRGYSGERITDVINIGIGGSDLGPAMVCGALKHLARLGVRSHFVSNIDSAHLLETLAELDWQRTLFVVASKTFSTEETLTNARSARRWLVERAGSEAAVRAHFVAVSTNRELVTQFGIDAENMFEFWDWVGGRYSLWSAIGLPIALAIGMPQFEHLLEGAHAMDQHFLGAPPEANMPLILALIGVWYRNFWGSSTHAILPYAQSLARFPAFLQQLEMESNGKRVDRNGDALDYASAPVVWGEAGTNGQHAFYQLIHQGTELIPVDFILAREAAYPLGDHHPRLAANCLAQAEALMTGKDAQEACAELLRLGRSQEDAERLAPHRTFIGDKPSSTILLPRLDARSLGALIALYEHKVFVQGVIWNINSFDQWGVELGKVLAKTIFSEIYGNIGVQPHDASTAALVRELRG